MSLLLNSLLSGNQIHPVQRTLEQLMAESPVTAKAGAVRQVTDYGGTIAVSDGTRWRLERLTCNWTDKPAANAVPVGTDLRVLDYNNVIFWSDGTYWRPRGVQNLYHKNGLFTQPLATVTGITSAAFSTPVLKIPAGMITPQSKLSTQVNGRKTTGIATAVFSITLGTSNSVADLGIVGIAIASPVNTDFDLASAAKFSSFTNRFFTQGWIGEGSTASTSSGISNDRVANVNTNADMYLNFYISSANIADSFNLLSYRVTIEA